jgi:hypothetical protein
MFDTAVSLKPQNPNFANDYLEYLREFEAICEKVLTRESWPLVGLFHEKKTEGRKFRDSVPLRHIIMETPT